MFGVFQIRWKKTAVVQILISTKVYAQQFMTFYGADRK